MLSGLIGIHGGRQQQAKSTSVPSLPNRGWNFVVEQLAKQRMSKLCPTGRIGFEHTASAKGFERPITGFDTSGFACTIAAESISSPSTENSFQVVRNALPSDSPLR